MHSKLPPAAGLEPMRIFVPLQPWRSVWNQTNRAKTKAVAQLLTSNSWWHFHFLWHSQFLELAYIPHPVTPILHHSILGPPRVISSTSPLPIHFPVPSYENTSDYVYGSCRQPRKFILSENLQENIQHSLCSVRHTDRLHNVGAGYLWQALSKQATEED